MRKGRKRKESGKAKPVGHEVSAGRSPLGSLQVEGRAICNDAIKNRLAHAGTRPRHFASMRESRCSGMAVAQQVWTMRRQSRKGSETELRA